MRGNRPGAPRVPTAMRYAEAVRALHDTQIHGLPDIAAAKGHAGLKVVINRLRKLANDLERGWKGVA